MSKYLELVEVSEGVVVLRRSDQKDAPLVKIEFSSEIISDNFKKLFEEKKIKYKIIDSNLDIKLNEKLVLKKIEKLLK